MSDIFDNSFPIVLIIRMYYNKYKVYLILDELVTQVKVVEVIDGVETEREVTVSKRITSRTPTGDVLSFCTNVMRRYVRGYNFLN